MIASPVAKRLAHENKIDIAQISGSGVEDISIAYTGHITEWKTELIRNAATAVLHYFKEEMGRSSVSVAEFSLALEQALSGLGLKGVNLKGAEAKTGAPRTAEADLLGSNSPRNLITEPY